MAYFSYPFTFEASFLHEDESVGEWAGWSSALGLLRRALSCGGLPGPGRFSPPQMRSQSGPCSTARSSR